MKTLKEKIKVMQAALDGEIVQYRDTFGNWYSNNDNLWNWGDYDYRIKPEPMEFIIDIYDGNRYEIASDRNRLMLSKLGKFKTIKVREVME